jgi:phage terminase small subunit
MNEQEPIKDEPSLAPLTPRQQAFVREYLIDLNGTQAAIRAGYNPNNATVQASTLLTYPNIHAAVEKGRAQRLSRVNMTSDTVLQEISILANSSIDHYYVDHEGQIHLTELAPEGAMGAIQSIKRKTVFHYDDNNNVIDRTYDVEIKLWDKPGQLKLMAKHAGLNFSDRVEITGKDGDAIITKVIREIVDPQDR